LFDVTALRCPEVEFLLLTFDQLLPAECPFIAAVVAHDRLQSGRPGGAKLERSVEERLLGDED
jgi:hypothetical protein